MQRSPKRRMLEPVPNGLSIGSNNVQVQPSTISQYHWSPVTHNANGQVHNVSTDVPSVGHFLERDGSQPKDPNTLHEFSTTVVPLPPTFDGNDEEAAVIGEPRMLVDPKGRLRKYCISLLHIMLAVESNLTPNSIHW